MKQKLLLIAASLMMAAAASAQWTKPTVTSFADMATDGETVQFMYNVGTQKFLVGANDWNTRASVGELADSVKIEALGDGLYAIHAIAVRNAGKTAWGYVSCNDWNAMWMDGYLTDGAANTAYPGTLSWKIRQEGDAYKLTNDEMYSAYELGDDATWGVPETFEGAATTRIYIYDPSQTYTKVENEEEFPNTPSFEGTFNDTWKFVSLDTYEAYVPKYEAYAAATSLLAAIEKAETDNPGINLSAQRAVYNNSGSTADELKAAEATIAAAVIDFVKGQATWENPVNFSSSIVNATFDVIGDFTGWQGSGFGAGGTTYTNAERWCMTFNTYQDLVGLPGGVYMLQCNGYCSTGASSLATDYAAWKAGTPAATKLYMDSKTSGYFSNSVIHVAQGASEFSMDSNNRTATVTDEDGVEITIYCPNTMLEADAYFHDGQNKFINNTYGVLTDGDTLRIGVSSDVSTDWSLFDDFAIYYFGDDIHAYQEWGKMVAENNNLNFSTYYGAPEKALYDGAINTITNATSKEAIVDAVKNLSVAIDSVTVSMTNYAAYLNLIDQVNTWLNDAESKGFVGDAVIKLGSYIDTDAEDSADESEVYGFPNGVSNYIIDWKNGDLEGKLSAAGIAEETEYLRVIWNEAMQEMQEGTDVTDLLINPAFSDGFTGWTNAAGNVGGLTTFRDVECFGTIVDCYQTVKAKPGVYAISVKAFERPAANGSFTGDEESLVYLYMNQFKTPVQNIVKDAMPEEKAIDKENCYIGNESGDWPYDYNVAGYGWVPNSMDGASYAFQAGRYNQTCYGLVGEDGVMKIGLTSNNKKVHWVLWADFHLTYMAKNEEALTSIIEYYATQAAELEGAGQPDQDALDEAVEKAQSAEGGDAMYAALFELIDAYNTAVESASMYEQAEAAIFNLETAMEEYAYTASEEAMETAQEKLDEYDDPVQSRTYAGSELAAVIADINNAIADLKVPDYSEPPTDFTGVIDNPDFAAGNSTPWIITVGYQNGGYQSASYTNEVEGNEWNGTTISQFIETWRNGAILGDGYIYQTIARLPAGQYKLECDAISSWQSDPSKEVTGVELVMAQAASADEVTSYSGTSMYTGNGQPEHFSVEFSKTGDKDTPLLIGIRVIGTNANWVAADNFMLTYLGSSLKGDVNGDGVVDIKDVVAIINHIAGTDTYANANVNGDTDDEGNDIVDINDVVAVINIMAGN